jgi:hypothetical protein
MQKVSEFTIVNHTVWKVRPATLEDVNRIVSLGHLYESRVNPYIHSKVTIEAYIDEWLVAEDKYGEIWGSIHYVSTNPEKKIRNYTYLRHMKLVQEDPLEDFFAIPSVFMSQLTCPGKGTLKALFNHLYRNSPRVCAWLSAAPVNKKILDYYTLDLGLIFEEKIYTFMNTYKGDWSQYRYGKINNLCCTEISL